AAGVELDPEEACSSASDGEVESIDVKLPILIGSVIKAEGADRGRVREGEDGLQPFIQHQVPARQQGMVIQNLCLPLPWREQQTMRGHKRVSDCAVIGLVTLKIFSSRG